MGRAALGTGGGTGGEGGTLTIGGITLVAFSWASVLVLDSDSDSRRSSCPWTGP